VPPGGGGEAKDLHGLLFQQAEGERDPSKRWQSLSYGRSSRRRRAWPRRLFIDFDASPSPERIAGYAADGDGRGHGERGGEGVREKK